MKSRRSILFMTLAGMVPAVTTAQRVIHFDAQLNYTDHHAMIVNTAKTCDSLRFMEYTGRPADPETVVCYEQDYNPENPFSLFEKDGVYLYVDSAGNLYSLDAYTQDAKPHYLGINLSQLTRNRRDLVLECDANDYDSLFIWAIPLDNYRLGRENRKGANKIALYYDAFVYPAKGQLSPSVLSAIIRDFRMEPEDGKVQDKLTMYIPVQHLTVPGSFSLYIYDLKGNILRMYTNLTQEETIIYRENFMSGTYRYAIFFDPGRVEIQKGLIHFIEPPKPE